MEIDFATRQAEVYERHRRRMRERSRSASLAGRDIAPIPEIVDPEAREKARLSLPFFCKHYHPKRYSRPWSKDHLIVLEKMQTAIVSGGQFAVAMPRGSGKTTFCEDAAEWALLFGYHRFVLFVGATASAACDSFNSIKADLDSNELIIGDFPEICYPIEELQGAANRAGGQHVAGVHTNIVWNNDLVVLPTTPNNPASGSVLRYAGIEGRIRGMKLKNRKTGENLRPTLCVVDDPQTDESARSDDQIGKRLDNIFKAILNLPGPGESITVFCPCTVIERNDLADRLLNRKLHPEWRGEKMKALYRFPDDMELWNRYWEIRTREFQEDGDGSESTAFYSANREAMDAGAEVAWPERFLESEISGLQFCMNKYFENEWAFMSEYQQEPKTVDLGNEQLTPAHTAAKLNNRPRYEVPLAANKVTAFVDVQKEALYYVVCAWSDDFSGQLIDYGTFPKQRRAVFESNSLNPKLSSLFPRDGLEGRLRKALEMWSEETLGREYRREDGSVLRVGKCLIDSSWGESTATVDKFCRESKFSPILTPSHGKFFGAQHKPLAFQNRKAGETHGHNWYYPNNRNQRAVRYVVYDSNYWKTFIYHRLLTSVGDSGSFEIFGSDFREHELLARHFSAETWTPTIGHDRVVNVWSLRPNEKENHWFDGVVGAAVAANELGASRPEFYDRTVRKQTFVSFSEASEAAFDGGSGEYGRTSTASFSESVGTSEGLSSFSFSDASGTASGADLGWF